MQKPRSSIRKIDLATPLFGLFILTMLAFLCVVLDALLRAMPQTEATTLRAYVAVVDDWQTLLGALFTPLVAVLSVWVVLRQIQEASVQEDMRLARRRRAQRSLMPIVMSRVCAYAQRCGAATREALALAGAEGVVVGARVKALTEVDDLSLDRISAMIEAAGDDAEAEAYAELLTQVQVQAARWRAFVGVEGAPERRFPGGLEDDLVDAAEIYARASNLLVQARPKGRVPGPPMSRQSALFSIGDRDFESASARLAAERDTAFPLTYADAPAPERRPLFRAWRAAAGGG